MVSSYNQKSFDVLADLFEIAGMLFLFPDEDTVNSIIEGTFADHLTNIEQFIPYEGDEKLNDSIQCLNRLKGLNQSDLFEELRKGYSALFLHSGSGVRIWPYEAPFRFVNDGRTGMPSLFRSPTTIDVEKQFASAGISPANKRKEPIDSFSNECFFISLLLREIASIDQDAFDIRKERVEQLLHFYKSHASKWFYAFLTKVQESAASTATAEIYANFTEIGIVATKVCARTVKQYDNV